MAQPVIPSEYIPRQNQALESKTFRPPPLDGSLTLPEIFDWHGKHSADHIMFEYVEDGSDADGGKDIHTICWIEAVHAMHRAAKLVFDTVKFSENDIVGAPVIAIVASSDSITYLSTIVGVMRAGYTVFPISPRNSAAAIAHLLFKTSVVHIFVGREERYRDLVNAAMDIFNANQYDGEGQDSSAQDRRGRRKIIVSEMPLFEDLYMRGDGDLSLDLPYHKADPDDIGIILHSSGSTAFPKPIKWTHRIIAQISLVPYFGERDLTGVRLGLQSIPMYHAMGIEQICWVATCGTIFTTFKPQSPAMVPTPDLAFKYASLTKTDLYFGVPSFIEAWSQNESYVKTLSEVDGVIYGGSPLSQIAGDYLAAKGVRLFNLYGSTEAGLVAPVLPRDVCEDWEYFRISPHVKPAFIPDPAGTETSELLIVNTQIHLPAIINSEHNGVKAYATSDLLKPHPTKEGYWKIFGRVDDQIMHNTGEKTNPGPLENILNQDAKIMSSIIFGRGRFQTGVLIDPSPKFKFDPSDILKLAKFRNEIWPTVEQMNAYAPQHSRLFKEMILVAAPSKPVTYTAKNTVRRQAVLREYEPEIDALYESVEETTQVDVDLPGSWDLTSVEVYVRTVIAKVIKKSIPVDADIFQHGCDSLQATWIRNTFIRAIRDGRHIETRNVSINFVYEHPTIAKLASFITEIASGVSNYASNTEFKVEEMMNVVRKYTVGLRSRAPQTSLPSPKTQTILLTGSTGGLGSNILVHLVADRNIGRIYALNRRASDGTSLKERQTGALANQGIDPALLNSEKVVLLEGDLTKADLGLTSNQLNEICSSMTHIIHNAWRVDFNLSLASFEPNIKGLRHLIDLALSSPLPSAPTILYTSSIGVFRHVNEVEPMKEEPIEASVAVGQGYSESKWVSEKILQVVARETSLRVVIVRVGQLSGGLNGSWNTKEWVPSMIRSGLYLKCLPALEEDISWIPINIAAKAIVELRASDASINHLVHPRPAKGLEIFGALSASLQIQLIPYPNWLAMLEKIKRDTEGNASTTEVDLMQRIPALRMLDFFRSCSTKPSIGQDEAMGFPKLSTEAAQRNAPSLSKMSLPKISSPNALQWLEYWEKIGYISSASSRGVA